MAALLKPIAFSTPICVLSSSTILDIVVMQTKMEIAIKKIGKMFATPPMMPVSFSKLT